MHWNLFIFDNVTVSQPEYVIYYLKWKLSTIRMMIMKLIFFDAWKSVLYKAKIFLNYIWLTSSKSVNGQKWNTLLWHCFKYSRILFIIISFMCGKSWYKIFKYYWSVRESLSVLPCHSFIVQCVRVLFSTIAEPFNFLKWMFSSSSRSWCVSIWSASKHAWKYSLAKQSLL